MAIIDNKATLMQESLTYALTRAEKVDISLAFFYFSGWRLFSKYLHDKKIRILVGKYIDPEAIPQLLSTMKQQGQYVELEAFQPRKPMSSPIDKKRTYIEGFLRLSNESSLFDESDDQEAFKILENKIADGSLEIKLSARKETGKLYVLHNKLEFSQNGDYPGNIIMSSSIFTFQGLLNQDELNEIYRDKGRFEEYTEKFESWWADSENIDIANLEHKDDLLHQFKEQLWLHSTPSPYAVYIRVLHEIFGKEGENSPNTPAIISGNKYFDLDYQIDAIKSVIDKLNEYDGVILADVVGLGKSIIASAAANSIGLKKIIIIAPPHLTEQWDEYQAEFSLPGARVFSSGDIKTAYADYQNSNQPLLIIVDEAHRYRNEDTDDYRKLHHICHSNPQNKVILLTATPFNNDPKDIFALIKLFQIPGQSTIRSVDNLSSRFRSLIDRYKKLRRLTKSGKLKQVHKDNEAKEISDELRRLIENVIIRRSRIDLQTITRYKENLESQNIDFPEIEGPELLKYDLGELSEPYLNTLVKIIPDEGEGGFIGARYIPATYSKDKKAFKEKYGEYLDESDLRTAQTNLAQFMKRLLVLRFESSKDAFRSTLKNMIDSHKVIEDWWSKLGKVPIMKRGKIPDPDTFLATEDVNKELNEQTLEEELKKELNEQTIIKELKKLKDRKGLIAVDRADIDDKFIDDVKRDRDLLTQIHEDWFGSGAQSIMGFDPKLDKVKEQIDALLSENPHRKIVVFSSYADTINYLHRELLKRGLMRLLKYTAADASKAMRKIIRNNFDAGVFKTEQEDNYDVLVTTDALSEGYNLHRAGVVINYDITYNPTRVIQRIGRINRINKKVFDKLFIYNFFPTETGESQIGLQQIATLKVRLINSVLGSDTKTLTNDENLQSFFIDEYKKAEAANEEPSWDAPHREAYDRAKKDAEAFDEATKIKSRSRVVRDGQKTPAIVAFGKKGKQAVFVLKELQDPSIVSAAVALKHFKANKEEKGKEADKHYDEVFKLVRSHLFDKGPLPSLRGRREDSLNVLRLIEENVLRAKDYCRDLREIIKEYDGINEGDLKSIAQLSVENYEKAFEELKKIVPQHQIDSIKKRASQIIEDEEQTIVLSEDIR